MRGLSCYADHRKQNTYISLSSDLFATMKIYHSWAINPAGPMPKNGSGRPRRLIELDPLLRIFLIGFLDVEEVHRLLFFPVDYGRERVKDCNLGVLGVELSSFI